jgi:hypothetical protein
MTKIIVLLVTCSWSFCAFGVAGTAPRWVQGKITNNTTQDIEVKVKYTLNCDKVTPISEKTKCLTNSGYILILKVSPRQTIAISDINSVVNKFPQSPEHGQFKNMLHVMFPAEPGTKTYAPVSYSVPDSDLEKIPKNFSVNFINGKMQLQVR